MDKSPKKQSFIPKKEDRNVIVALVKSLLQERPNDPVPFMYSYLKQAQNGKKNPIPPKNADVAEIKNLRKKYEILKSQLAGSEESHSEESENS